MSDINSTEAKISARMSEQLLEMKKSVDFEARARKILFFYDSVPPASPLRLYILYTGGGGCLFFSEGTKKPV